mmetsp:Transcript_2923/g.4237  ORF Transcript_2923/g.4237 Transcript_2923/m.4237 type:complete len:120 (-) Transcript_2923:132-491(-)
MIYFLNRKCWTGGKKETEIEQVSKLVNGIRKGKTRWKKMKKAGTSIAATDDQKGNSDSVEETNKENVERIRKWKEGKLEAWKAGDSNLKKKCPTRPELEFWMETQSQKALNAVRKKFNK